MAPAWLRAARLEDLVGDGPHALAAGGVDLVALRVNGALQVYEGRCPHQGALLGEGEIEGSTLVCRNHRWRFDGETGQRAGGRECLAKCRAQETGGELLVDVSALVQNARTSRGTRKIADLPRPRGIPVLGNALQLDPSQLHAQLEGWAGKYGKLFALRLASRDVIVISDSDLAEPIMRARPDTYRRVALIEAVFRDMGLLGVFSAEGDDWRAQRRLAMQALSQRHLRSFFPTLEIVAGRLVRRWQRAADAGATLDIAAELKRFTVDVTTQLVFGHDLNTLETSDEASIQRHLEVFFPAVNRRLNAVVPYWRWVRLPSDRRLDRAIADIRVWIDAQVEASRAVLAAKPEHASAPANFLEAMLVARDAQGELFSDDVVFANALTMLLAGEDTTAYTLAWAVHHLCEDAAATKALRAETDRVLGERSVPANLEEASLLPYAMGVANETMRLRPVAPLFFFEPLRDVVVGDVEVPKGTTILVLTRPPAVDDAHFSEASSFIPERWMPGERKGAHDPAAHIPFGTGPRICPGRSLALLEMRLVLATLYRNFEVERVGAPAEVTEVLAFTMMPVGLHVRLRRRASSASSAS